MTSIKSILKSALARVGRPAIWPLHERIVDLVSRLEQQRALLDTRADDLARRIDQSHQRLDQIEDLLESIAGATVQREKHREELAFWRWLINTPEGRASVGGSFAGTFGRWQRERLRELGLALNLLDNPAGPALDPAFDGFVRLPDLDMARLDHAVDQWCAQQSALEIGGGPYPALAAAPRWQRAVAVDPIARAYTEESLAPPGCEHIVWLEAPGERVPLPTASVDLAILENALDHVTDPHAVLAEIRRLLRPTGRLWLLVDLSTHRDPMHPHPFDEARVRKVLHEAGFAPVVDRVSAHHSHPKAFGEYRGLLRPIPADPPRTPQPDARARSDV